VPCGYGPFCFWNLRVGGLTASRPSRTFSIGRLSFLLSFFSCEGAFPRDGVFYCCTARHPFPRFKVLHVATPSTPLSQARERQRPARLLKNTRFVSNNLVRAVFLEIFFSVMASWSMLISFRRAPELRFGLSVGPTTRSLLNSVSRSR